MNSYSELLRKAFDEVGVFAESKKGAEWPKKWYSELQRLLALAADEDDERKVEKLLDVIVLKVSTSGPLEPRFSPSLRAARVAMQARHKKPTRLSSSTPPGM
jgi:hypothetical protein